VTLSQCSAEPLATVAASGGSALEVKHAGNDDGISSPPGKKLTLGDWVNDHVTDRGEASISNMLKRLVKGGWVERRVDAYDYRITRVFLTQKGIDLRTAVEAELGAVDRDLREILPANEYTKLAALLDRSLDCLKGSLECGAMDEGHPTGIYDREGPPGNA